MHSALNFSQRYAKQKINLAYPYMIIFALAVKKNKNKFGKKPEKHSHNDTNTQKFQWTQNLYSDPFYMHYDLRSQKKVALGDKRK